VSYWRRGEPLPDPVVVEISPAEGMDCGRPCGYCLCSGLSVFIATQSDESWTYLCDDHARELAAEDDLELIEPA
jgi:hypothetical protein